MCLSIFRHLTNLFATEIAVEDILAGAAGGVRCQPEVVNDEVRPPKLAAAPENARPYRLMHSPGELNAWQAAKKAHILVLDISLVISGGVEFTMIGFCRTVP